DDPNTIFVGAQGVAWGPTPDRGVYKTTDGGKTWKKVLYINDETGIADLIADPTNPNKLIAATWEYGRKPWTFNSGGKGSGIHISYDGGENWERIDEQAKSGLPKGPLGRIGVAMAYSKPNILYALVEAKKNGLYKSTDGGHKWKKISEENIGNRPFYYAELYVDPSNENRIWNLYTYVSKSEDGGKTFKTILDYGKGVHPDHHAFWIHPQNSNYLIDGNDGGLNISRDGGKNWRFIENLPLGQFYHINYDMEYPYQVFGGMQDNGTWVGPSQVWKSGGIRNSDWREVLFGDGFDILLRKDDNRYGLGMSQGGNIVHFDRFTGYNQYVKPVHPDGIELRFNWNAALAQHPGADCGIYFGSQFLHKSMDCGQSWEIISPDLTTNDTLKQKESANTGGLTLDVTQAENFTTIVSIAPSPVNQQVIWVGTDDGNLQLTQDGGKNWVNLASRLSGVPAGSWIPQIEVSAKNAGEAFVVVNNYRRNDWTPYLFHTQNFGQSWQQLANPEQVSGYAQCVVQDPEEENLLFMGTDRGLYVSIDRGRNWTQWTNDYPSVSTRDLKIHPREHDLIVGTFGRAAWILDDIRPLREMAGSQGAALAQNFKAFAAPDAYLAEFRSVDGVRFTADAHFRGKNRSRSAMLSLWVKPKDKDKEKKATELMSDNSKKKKKKKKKDKAPQEAEKGDDPSKEKKAMGKKKSGDKVQVKVVNAKGDTIRHFSSKLKPGLNRIYWGLRHDGIRFPSYRDAKPDADPPRGPRILPGTYQLFFHYGDAIDSTQVVVHADPRLNLTPAQLQAQQKARMEYYDKIAKATEGFERLKAAKKTIKRVDGQMVHAVDSLKKDIAEAGKAMQDSIDQLMRLYMLPQKAKGIQRTSNTLTSKIFRSMGYLDSGNEAVSPNGQYAIDQAQTAIAETLEQINHFFETDWKNYQEKVEAVPYSLFKTYEPIQME
ncbi:MAG: hypothetical protein AAGD05_08400, partial [Bacteroidota bacterium]